MAHLEGTDENEEKLFTFEFHIKETVEATHIKNIHPSSLPNFCGASSEDPDTFLFKFMYYAGVMNILPMPRS